MKNLQKLALLLVVTLSGFNLVAQTSFRGSMIISGNTNLNFITMENTRDSDFGEESLGKQNTFDFSPEIGWFVNDDLILGVGLPINITTNKDEDGDKTTVSSYILAPFAKHYFGKGNVRPFFQAILGYGITKYKEDTKYFDYDADSYEMNSFLYGLGGGFSFFLNQNIALDFSTGYNHITSKPKDDNDSDYKMIKKGFQANVGFTIIF
ncbi:MAG: outer membrane beta-barrel protein [Marinifilaceae bacterium]